MNELYSDMSGFNKTDFPGLIISGLGYNFGMVTPGTS